MDYTADYSSILRQLDIDTNIDWLQAEGNRVKKLESYGKMTVRSQIETFIRTVQKTGGVAFLIEPGKPSFKICKPRLEFFYPHVNRFLAEYSDRYYYSPRIKLFFQACDQLAIHPGSFEFQKPLEIDLGSGKQYGVLFNELIETVRHLCGKSKFKNTLKSYEQTMRRRHVKGLLWEDNLFQWHSRHVFVYVHLGYKELYRHQVTPELIQRHRDTLLENRRMNELLQGINAYIWRLEDGDEVGLHMHALIAYRGDANSGIHIAGQICRYWEEVVTAGMGKAWNGNLVREKRRDGKESGLGKIDAHETDKREALREVIAYLTKADQHLKWKHLQGLRAIGMSRPKEKIKQGRPRMKEQLA